MELKTDVVTVTEVVDECPNCQGRGILWKHSAEGYFIECENECGPSNSVTRTDYFDTIQEAIDAWNNREMV